MLSIQVKRKNSQKLYIFVPHGPIRTDPDLRDDLRGPPTHCHGFGNFRTFSIPREISAAPTRFTQTYTHTRARRGSGEGFFPGFANYLLFNCYSIEIIIEIFTSTF